MPAILSLIGDIYYVLYYVQILIITDQPSVLDVLFSEWYCINHQHSMVLHFNFFRIDGYPRVFSYIAVLKSIGH